MNSNRLVMISICAAAMIGCARSSVSSELRDHSLTESAERNSDGTWSVKCMGQTGSEIVREEDFLADRFCMNASDFLNSCEAVKPGTDEDLLKQAVIAATSATSCKAIWDVTIEHPSLYLADQGLRTLSLISGLPHLQYLYLSDNEVGDIAPLASLSQLRVLNLVANEVVDLAPIAELSLMEHLDVLENTIERSELRCPARSNNKTLNAFCEQWNTIEEFANDTHRIN